MKETGQSISEWAFDTFGESGTDLRVAARANEEMAELLRALTAGASRSNIVDECADVAIILVRLAWRNGHDLFEAIDGKMAVNRRREWALDGTGHGYHVREKSSDD